MKFNHIIASVQYFPSHFLKPRLYRLYTTHFNAMFSREEPEKEHFVPSPDWYRAAYAKIIRLSHILQNVEQSNGRLINNTNSKIITDSEVISHMNTFNSIAKAFISTRQIPCWSRTSQFKSVTVNSLKVVAELLSMSTQQRKLVRVSILPQVTQHRIWREALLVVLKDVKLDVDSLKCQSKSLSMAEQIVVTCISFLSDMADAPSPGSPSWVKLGPAKKVEEEVRHKWEEVVEMFADLMKCLSREPALSHQVTKLEAMNEGLKIIRDIVIERDVNHREARQQDSSIQWKLTKNLGHSSKCLFTLVLYYLYGSVLDIEVEVCGGLRRNGKKLRFCAGKVLTSDNEEMLLKGVRQLSRALGVFKLVWETSGAATESELDLHGHLWCFGAEEKVIKHRGYEIYLHTIKPCH